MTVSSSSPQLYSSLHPEQRQVLRWSARVMLISLIGFGVLKTMPLFTSYLGTWSAQYPELKPIHKTLALWFGETSESASTNLSPRAKSRFVLGDTSLLNDLRFTVNVPTNLRGGVSVVGNTQITGDLAVTGDVSAQGLAGSTATIQGALSAGSLTTPGSLTATGNLQVGNITRIRGVNYSFPSSQGSGDSFLRNDGSGTLTWQTISVPSIPSIPSKYSDLSGGEIKDASGVTSSGTITFSAFSANGGLLYTNGSGTLAQTTVGSANQCLASSGGGAPVWTDCTTYGSNWTVASGTISPKNSTLDFLVGGTATSSAKFALLNINTGTPTASISAGTSGAMYLTATGSAQTTNRQDMTFGGGTTGNIIFTNRNNTPLMSMDTYYNEMFLGRPTAGYQMGAKLNIQADNTPENDDAPVGVASVVHSTASTSGSNFSGGMGGSFSLQTSGTGASYSQRQLGIRVSLINDNTGSVVEGKSVQASLTNSAGTMTSGYGYQAWLTNSGASSTITSLYGYHVRNLTNSGTIANTYGVYVGDITAGTQTATPFSFYASDTGAYNFFAGNTGIGTGATAPGAMLQVNTAAAATKGVIVKGAASQTANLQEWQNSSGTALASVNSAGTFTNSVSTGDTSGVKSTSFSTTVDPTTANALTTASGSIFQTTFLGSTTQTSLSITGISQTVNGAGSIANVTGISSQTNNSAFPVGASTITGAIKGAVIEAYATSPTTTPVLTGLLVQSGSTNTTGSGASSITAITGIESKLNNFAIGGALTSTNAYGIRSNSNYSTFSGGTFTITNMYGLYVDPITTASVTSTNRYGLYLGAVSGASTLNYSIYSAGGVNYFADSIGIGTTSFGTSADNVLAIAGSTAPSTSITDGVQLFAVDVAGSHELRVRDEAGNVTTLSPHNFSLIPEGRSEDLAWSFYSERDGKAINVDMTKALRVVEDLSGEQLVFLKDLQTNEETVASRSGVPLVGQVAAIQAHISLTDGIWTFLKDVAFSAKAKFMGVVEFMAEVKFRAETTFENLTIFKGALRVSGDTSGSVVIPSQATKVKVHFEKPFATTPTVSLFAPKQTSAKFELVEVSPNAFVVELKQALAEPLTIQWWAVESSATKPATIEVLEQNGVVPTPVPSLTPSAAPQSPVPTPSIEPVASPTPSPSPTPEPSITPVATSSAEPTPEQSTPSATLPQ